MELPMKETQERIYIPLSPWRLGNYLLILHRRAPMVVTLDLSLWTCFVWEGEFELLHVHERPPSMVYRHSLLHKTIQSGIIIRTPTPAPTTWARFLSIQLWLVHCNKSPKRSLHTDRLNTSCKKRQEGSQRTTQTRLYREDVSCRVL